MIVCALSDDYSKKNVLSKILALTCDICDNTFTENGHLKILKILFEYVIIVIIHLLRYTL